MLGALVVAVAIAVGVIGSVVYISTSVPSHVVPAELVGAHEDEVTDLVGGLGWRITTEENYFDGTEAGEIVRTDPEPGTSLREGEVLTLHVSLGPPLVAVPQNLAGMTPDEAEAALAADGVGLKAEFVDAPDDDVEPGRVIGLAEDVPENVPRGSTVRVLVSSGDEDLEMPDLEGDQLASAQAQLEAMGLEVEIEAQERRNRDEGEVIRTEPRAGDDVDRGDTVVLVVAANGSEGGGAQVPDLAGASFDDAQSALEDAGLSVGNVSGPQDGVVVSPLPLSGTELEPGSSVDLIMRPAG
jgi:serine/threonine-protein kinase